MKAAFKKIFSYVLRIGISIALLVFIFKWNKIDIGDLFTIIKGADKPVLAAAMLIFIFNYLLGFYRWEMLLKAIKLHLPMRRIVNSFCGGIFSSLFLPSTIGGDLTRGFDLSAHTRKPKQVVATIFLDRLSGYTGLVLVAAGSLVFGWNLVKDYPFVLFSILAITGLLVVILLVLFNSFVYAKINSLHLGRVMEIVKGLHQEIHYFRNYRKVIIINLALSLAIQLLLPTTVFLIARSVGIQVNLMYFLIFLPIIGAVTLLPISIGGLGLRESMTVLLFAHAGIDQHLSLGMSLLNFAFLVICSGIAGIIYVFTVHYRRVQRHQTPLLRPDSPRT